MPIDITCPILPGISAAGIVLGQSVESLLNSDSPAAVESRGDFVRHDFSDVQVWAEDGHVQQVGVYGTYQGRLPNGIGLGNAIADVESAFGAEVLEDDDDVLVVSGSPGWCFDTEEWIGDHTVKQNRNARLVAIFVHSLK